MLFCQRGNNLGRILHILSFWIFLTAEGKNRKCSFNKGKLMNCEEVEARAVLVADKASLLLLINKQDEIANYSLELPGLSQSTNVLQPDHLFSTGGTASVPKDRLELAWLQPFMRPQPFSGRQMSLIKSALILFSLHRPGVFPAWQIRLHRSFWFTFTTHLIASIPKEIL